MASSLVERFAGTRQEVPHGDPRGRVYDPSNRNHTGFHVSFLFKRSGFSRYVEKTMKDTAYNGVSPRSPIGAARAAGRRRVGRWLDGAERHRLREGAVTGTARAPCPGRTARARSAVRAYGRVAHHGPTLPSRNVFVPQCTSPPPTW